MAKPGVYDCYENGWDNSKRYVCTGTIAEIADATGLAIATVRHYRSGPGGHRYDIVRHEEGAK